MVRIMLACAAGMSTSLVVTKMVKAAEEQGVECKIWAVSESTVKNNLGEFDVLLLGPQVRFMEKKLKDIVGPEVPVEVINMMHYGMCDGKAIFNRAMELYNSK